MNEFDGIVYFGKGSPRRNLTLDIFTIIGLLGGLAMFLYGMEVMGDGLKHSSASTLKKVLEKATKNVVVGVLTGVLVTGVIQSSTATIVLTVGLMGAGVFNLRQATSIVMGANIGTTITAQIIRLMDIDSSGNMVLEFFKPGTLGPIALIIGIILIMFIKSKNTKMTGAILMGLGLVFVGLVTMTDAVKPLAESELFVEILNRFSQIPVLGILAGLVITVIIQSSSATVGILQALSVTGAMTLNMIYPVVMGINLGTCITTAMVCSIGSSRDAKRVGVVHIVFNVIGTVLFMIGIEIIKAVGLLNADFWTKIVNSGSIANFQTIFNLFTAVALIPFTSLLMKISMLVVRSKDEDTDDVSPLKALDEKLFVAPALAMKQVHESVASMAELAKKNISLGFLQLSAFSEERRDVIERREGYIDEFADAADNFLVKLSPHIEGEYENRNMNLLIQAVGDFERIGDYAVNIEEFAKKLSDDKLSFSESALKELAVVKSAVEEIIDTTVEAFKENDSELASRIEPLEEVIDELVDLLKDRHMDRLKKGKCTVSAGLVFIETLTNAERAADQCSNIGLYIMGCINEEILPNRHSYLRELHKAEDPRYRAEFEQKRAAYLSEI